MARLYESSTDYEENVTYAGDTLASDRYDSEADYDRITVTYEGVATDTPQGYASTSITYADIAASYNGSKTVDRTAIGTGTGTSTTTAIVAHIRTATEIGTGTSSSTAIVGHVRQATGTGTGTETATPLRAVLRTGTGAGTGTSENAILHEHLRTSYGTGGATAGDTATGLRIVLRTGTGAGVSGSSVTYIRGIKKTASGSGTGNDIPADWTKSFIFRPPVDDDFPYAHYLGRGQAHRLYGFFTPGPRARNIYKLTDGTFTTVDPRNDNEVVAIYLGSHANFVTAEEKADLVAAGYEVT